MVTVEIVNTAMITMRNFELWHSVIILLYLGRAIIISAPSPLYSATIVIFLALDFLQLPDLFLDFGQLIQIFFGTIDVSLLSSFYNWTFHFVAHTIVCVCVCVCKNI